MATNKTKQLKLLLKMLTQDEILKLVFATACGTSIINGLIKEGKTEVLQIIFDALSKDQQQKLLTTGSNYYCYGNATILEAAIIIYADHRDEKYKKSIKLILQYYKQHQLTPTADGLGLQQSMLGRFAIFAKSVLQEFAKLD